MKSRVQKNAELYHQINSDAESSLDNSSLSSFASRLNEIDKQFEKIAEKQNSDLRPSRAKSYHDDAISMKDINHTISDTFESDYLLEFLEEVRNYNVSSGRQSQEDIVQKFFSEQKVEEQSPQEGAELVSDTDEHVSVYREDKDLEETIAMVIQDMKTESDDSTDHGETIVMSVIESDPETIIAEEESSQQALLEETQALKLKLDRQSSDYDELNQEYSRAGRLLNVTIILLVFAIIALAAIIIYQLI